jgi:GT2 family glycosyltransferase
MEKGKVVIVVLNYNGRKCLPKTLTSLQEIAYLQKQVLVVDNASTDDSFSLAQRDFPEYAFLPLAYNGGFAYGMNQGIQWALLKGADYIWLFNYDAIADREALSELVSEAERENDAVLLSPLILDQDNNRWFSGGRINYLRMRVEHDKGLTSEMPQETGFLTGCALFIPRKVVEQVGFLDEDFFLYYEDADYSTRTKEMGIALKVVPRARVFHSEESRFNPSKVYHLVLSGLIFFDKKKKSSIFSFYQAIYVILRRLKNQIDLLFNRPNAESVRKAYQDYYARKKSNHLSHFRQLSE